MIPPTNHFIENEVAGLSMVTFLQRALEAGDWKGQGIEINEIREKLTIKRLDNTDLIRLSIELSSKQKSKVVLENLIEAYVASREKLRKNLFRDVSNKLSDEMLKQSDLVVDYQKEITVILQSQEILNTNIDKSPEQQVLADLSKRIITLRLTEVNLRLEKEQPKEKKSDSGEIDEELTLVASQIRLLEKLAADSREELLDLSLKHNLLKRVQKKLQREQDILYQMKAEHRQKLTKMAEPSPVVLVREFPH